MALVERLLLLWMFESDTGFQRTGLLSCCRFALSLVHQTLTFLVNLVAEPLPDASSQREQSSSRRFGVSPVGTYR